MSHPLSKCFVYLFKIYLVYSDTSSAKLGKDIIVALAYKQDCEILTMLIVVTYFLFAISNCIWWKNGLYLYIYISSNKIHKYCIPSNRLHVLLVPCITGENVISCVENDCVILGQFFLIDN
jgi:hypothetical protein